MENKKLTPVTRINKFFSEEDFNLEISMSRESLEGDGNFTVILYSVDRTLTEYDDIYNESSKNGIRYLPPVELKVNPVLEESENKSYNSNGSLRYLQDGKFTFEIYDSQLYELNTNIKYGDYIGYPVSEKEIRFFSVTDDGVKNYDNKHTIMGYKAAYRTIKCAAVDNTEFSSI
jgi:hypothetical protein